MQNDVNAGRQSEVHKHHQNIGNDPMYRFEKAFHKVWIVKLQMILPRALLVFKKTVPKLREIVLP